MPKKHAQAPCIIAVAITGSVPRKEHNPAVPITLTEQLESTHAAFEAGAALVHVHVRNDDQSTTSNPDKFAAFQERIRPLCPGHHRAVLHRRPFGRGLGARRHAAPAPRHGLAGHRLLQLPDARLRESPRPDRRAGRRRCAQHDVKPEIEVFDLAMLYNAVNYVRAGAIKPPLHVQFVLGVKHALAGRTRHPGVPGVQAARADARGHVGGGRRRAAISWT